MKAPVPDPLANSTLLNNTVTFTERHDLPKLAAVPVPKFDGDQENWVLWKATFEAMIHDRPGLSGVVKLDQLKNAVSGLDLQVINEFCRSPSDQNYLAAWEALCKAYDQRRVIVNEHFDALLNLAPHPKPTADTTAGLMYTVRQHISMLKAMEITIGVEVVVRILERCLPKEILEKWIEQVSSGRYPKLEQFYNFIQNSVFKQRQIDKAPSVAHPNKRPGGKNSAPPAKMSKPTARSLVTTSTSSSNSCPKCGQNHRLYSCEEFKKGSMKEKWDFVYANKLC
ncbi:uncharacterized protein LOC117175522 [Belonocnema kinseyi]|uniref:uncharacterized protein LOC117175522 n=1 Tax=Belonocnema kinseyi TaxID=2817044 RepID=UPI00143E06E5|nr:uncharacterized protein LOC117175522 [Belonocnema kinseyi]